MKQTWRDRDAIFINRLLKSQQKWQFTAYLLADLLKDVLPERFHEEIDEILTDNKETVCLKLLDYRRSKDAQGTGDVQGPVVTDKQRGS